MVWFAHTSPAGSSTIPLGPQSGKRIPQATVDVHTVMGLHRHADLLIHVEVHFSCHINQTFTP